MGMNITRENCLNCYFFASMYDIHFLKSEAREKICKNFSSVIRSQDFLGLPLERVTHILSFSDAKLVSHFESLHIFRFVIQKKNVDEPLMWSIMYRTWDSRRSIKPASLFKGEKETPVVACQHASSRATRLKVCLHVTFFSACPLLPLLKFSIVPMVTV